MNKRVYFFKDNQRNFIRHIKNKTNLSWKDLAQRLDVNESTLSKSYRFELCRIPYYLFKRLLLIANEDQKMITENNYTQFRTGVRFSNPGDTSFLSFFLGYQYFKADGNPNNLEITAHAVIIGSTGFFSYGLKSNFEFVFNYDLMFGPYRENEIDFSDI